MNQHSNVTEDELDTVCYALAAFSRTDGLAEWEQVAALAAYNKMFDLRAKLYPAPAVHH